MDKGNSGGLNRVIWIVGVFIYLVGFLLVTGKYLTENRYFEVKVPASVTSSSTQKTLEVNVVINNKSNYTFDSKDKYFLSYHLFSLQGDAVAYENTRSEILAIKPGQAKSATLKVTTPARPGEYLVEVDIVKEGEYWFKDRGNKTRTLSLKIKG